MLSFFIQQNEYICGRYFFQNQFGFFLLLFRFRPIF